MKKNCEECRRNAETDKATVPFFVHENEMMRAERNIKRLWIIAIILIFLLFASNAGWLIYESQFETLTYSYEYEQDGEGTNIIGNDNEVNNDGAKTQG